MDNKKFKISVICSTYNNPDSLRLCLSGLSMQADSNFEIIIADDGSTSETKRVIDLFISQFSKKIPIKHVWHEDLGFRLSEIRNKASLQTAGDYLLFLDGDCIPLPHWISYHRSLAEKNWTVAGQRILLSQSLTEELTTNQFQFQFLHSNLLSFFYLSILYLKRKINRPWPALHLPLGPIRKIRPDNWKMIRGCNWGIWKNDYFSVNGCDESFDSWGHEDSDLAVRLLNFGIRFKSGAFTAPVLHLWHNEASKENSSSNWNIVLKRLKDGTISIPNGIQKY